MVPHRKWMDGALTRLLPSIPFVRCPGRRRP